MRNSGIISIGLNSFVNNESGKLPRWSRCVARASKQRECLEEWGMCTKHIMRRKQCPLQFRSWRNSNERKNGLNLWGLLYRTHVFGIQSPSHGWPMHPKSQPERCLSSRLPSSDFIHSPVLSHQHFYYILNLNYYLFRPIHSLLSCRLDHNGPSHPRAYLAPLRYLRRAQGARRYHPPSLQR